VTKMPATMALFRALVILVLATSFAVAQDKVPAEFQGDWVPATATCGSPARFRVTESKMTLVNGKDSASYGDIAIAHSFFGPDYQGISVVAMPELNSGNPPFTVYFNADEHKGVTKLEIYQEIKGVQNAQVKAIQATAKKLAERFPLNSVPLKKCAGGKG
jgi:hypothetical protein